MEQIDMDIKMQVHPDPNSIKGKLGAWLNSLSLIAVMHFVAFRFFQQSTMFPFIYPDLYKTATLLSLAFVGGIRFLYLFVHQLKGLEGRSARLRLLIKAALAACLAVPFIYVGLKNDSRPLVFLPFAALCLYDMDAKRVLRCFAWTVGVAFAATVICCLGGAIRNIAQRETNSTPVSLGFINTTDFASYFTFLILIVWCAQKDQNRLASLLLLALTGLCGYTVYRLTESRTAILCSAATMAVILWDCLEKSCFRMGGKALRAQRLVNGTAVAVFPLVFILFSVLMLAFYKQNTLAVEMNNLLTKRIRVPIDMIRKYGIHPFGSLIENMNGNGRTVMGFWLVNDYGYLDSAYAMLAIRYGWVLSLIVTGLWVTMGFRALRRGASRFCLAMGIIAMHAFSEAHFWDVNYNILLIMPFCSFGALAAEEASIPEALPGQRRSEGFPWFSYASALFIGIGVSLAAPFALSWLRTIFYLKGWLVGLHTFGALLVSLGLVLLVIAVWKGLNTVWAKRSGKSVITLALPAALLILCILMGNSVIQQGLTDQAERLSDDEEAIRLAQSAAVQPVYAAEKSALYQRRFGGFSEHAFTTEELIRPPQGTMFTDRAAEAVSLVFKGGGAQYAQISPWSGVYSYDPKVIEALTAAGYEWTDFYSSERSCDLWDLAVRNRLSLDDEGRLVLDGSEYSLTTSLEYDQVFGYFEITYALQLPENVRLESGRPVCTLLVMGQAGQKPLAVEPLTADRFGEDRRCVVTIEYYTVSSPCVTFQVHVQDGVQLLVEDISWRKTT